MSSTYTLGQHFEAFIQAQLASGRYSTASEVVRDALRLMEERERRLAAVDAALDTGETPRVKGKESCLFMTVGEAEVML